MDLDEYLWRTKTKHEVFAEMADITKTQVSLYATKKRSPSLRVAVQIHEATHGLVTFKELLSDKDKKKIKRFSRILK